MSKNGLVLLSYSKKFILQSLLEFSCVEFTCSTSGFLQMVWFSDTVQENPELLKNHQQG